MSYKRLKWFVLVVVLLAALLGGCAKKEAPEKSEAEKSVEPEFVIRLHHGLPVNHYLAVSHDLWAQKVSEKSNGRVTIKIYPAAQLYNDKSAVQAVMTGAIEACWNYDHKFFTAVPAIGGIGLPAAGIAAPVYSDNVRVIEAMYDAAYEGRGPGAMLAEKFEEVGMKLIYFIFWSEKIGMASKGKPIMTPKDLKGRKIRTTTSSDAKKYKAFGAEPVSLTGAELYEAMSRGTINTAGLTMCHLEERKMKETIDYEVMPTEPMTCIGQVVMNMDYWNKLPEDIQKLLLETGRETDRERRGLLAELQKEYRTKIESEGRVEFIDLSPEQQKPWIEFSLMGKKATLEYLGEDAIKIWDACQEFKKELGVEPYPHYADLK